jgi:hypothetical protein
LPALPELTTASDKQFPGCRANYHGTYRRRGQFPLHPGRSPWICANSKQEIVMTRSAIRRTGRVSALTLAIGLATASIGFAQSTTTNTYMNPDGSATSVTTTPLAPVTVVPAPGTSSSTDTTIQPNNDGSTTTYSTTKTQDYMGNSTTRWSTQTTKP